MSAFLIGQKPKMVQTTWSSCLTNPVTGEVYFPDDPEKLLPIWEVTFE